jgi:hypothetical protein
MPTIKRCPAMQYIEQAIEQVRLESRNKAVIETIDNRTMTKAAYKSLVNGLREVKYRWGKYAS